VQRAMEHAYSQRRVCGTLRGFVLAHLAICFGRATCWAWAVSASRLECAARRRHHSLPRASALRSAPSWRRTGLRGH
jgi:hypothetical protein